MPNKTDNNNLQQAILGAVAFFDMFDYPLTDREVERFLYCPKQKFSQQEIKKQLEKMVALSFLEQQEEFCFLSGRQEIVKTRNKREKISKNKLKKVQRVARVFSWLPFVLFIGLANFMPFKNTRPESDLDFFIVARKGRLWLARFLTVIFSYFLGGRPTPHSQKNKICLSFFVDEENLNLEKIALGKDDIYLHYWLVNLYPLYNKEKTYEKLLKTNKWVVKYLPFAVEIGQGNQTEKVCQKKKILGRVGDFLEKAVKGVQLKKMPQHLKDLANQDTRVIISEGILKFHDKDRREYYREEWKEKVKKVTD